MRGVFDEEDVEHEKSARDTEFTLGAGMLLMLLFGLLLVCGLCFGLGYAFGHNAALSQQASASSPLATPSASSIPKPSALAQAPASPATAPASSASPVFATAPPQPATAVAVPVSSPQPATSAAPATPPPAQPGAQPQVRPALPFMTSQPPPMAPVPPSPTTQPVRPANLPLQNPFWVQIAAVSHVEDAQVLTEALRRRGYTVTPRREPSDNLIHVRIGPFATQSEAANWRMKLLNDGYNAMIQP